MKAHNNVDKNYSLWLQKISTAGLVVIFIFTLLSGIRFFTVGSTMGSDKDCVKNYTVENISSKNNKKNDKRNKMKDRDKENQSNDDMNLNINFAEGVGRTNPFIPVESSMQTQPGQIAVSNVPYQVPVSSISQSQILFPAQLPPIPDQKIPEKVPSIEVPAWPTHSPILTAGPPERLASMLKLRVTGIVEERDGKKFAVVEEMVKSYNPQNKGELQEVRSHIVKVGNVITEYRLSVKSIDKNLVVLTRGNQRIDLYLKEQPKTLTAPPLSWQGKSTTTETVPASQAK